MKKIEVYGNTEAKQAKPTCVSPRPEIPEPKKELHGLRGLNSIRCRNCNRGFSVLTWEAEGGIWACPNCGVKHRMMLEVVSNE